MTAAERAARIAELDTDIALTRAARRTILSGGQAYTAEGRTMSRADLAQLDATEKLLCAERDKLNRGRASRSYSVNYR